MRTANGVPGARLDYQDRFSLPNQRGGATKEAIAAELALVDVAPPVIDVPLAVDSKDGALIG